MQEKDLINKQNPTEELPYIQSLNDELISEFQHYYETNLEDFTTCEISDDPLKADANKVYLIRTRKDSRICSNKKKQKSPIKKAIKKTNIEKNERSSSKLSDVFAKSEISKKPLVLSKKFRMKYNSLYT